MDNKKIASELVRLARVMVAGHTNKVAWEEDEHEDEDYEFDNKEYEVDVPSQKDILEMKTMAFPTHGSWNGHLIWDKLTSHEKHEMQQYEKEYKHWGAGPYISETLAQKHGFHHLKIIGHEIGYSDSAYRQWKDTNSGVVFWDFLEG